MGEPLKKNKLHHITIKKKGEEVKHYRTDVDIEDLKSALEEFETRIKLWGPAEIVYTQIKDDLMKAFPAIYGDKE